MDRGAWWAEVHGVAELDMTERLHFHFSSSCIGEGNGNPLQCSCLENPRDGEVWWAAIYGLAQSRTWLTWLSSSNIPKGFLPMQETQVWSLGWEDPLEKEMKPTPIVLPREFHGQRSLVGYSPPGHKESDMSEWLNSNNIPEFCSGL